MKTGIVMEVKGRKAVLLKADGSFVSVRAERGWRRGDVVAAEVRKSNHAVLIRACAACLALMLAGGLGWNRLYAAPVALISVDVNPSIELSVNRFQQVVNANALNEEGAGILEETKSRHMDYQEALANILAQEGEEGYLDTGAEVVLTVFSSDPALQTQLLSELQGIVDSNIALYSGEVTAEYHAVDEAVINGAHGHGVTAGKYLYLQRLQELAPQTDITQYVHHSIEEIKGEIRTCEEEHGEEHGTKRKGHHHGGGH